jgi:hypothetical protein
MCALDHVRVVQEHVRMMQEHVRMMQLFQITFLYVCIEFFECRNV